MMIAPGRCALWGEDAAIPGTSPGLSRARVLRNAQGAPGKGNDHGIIAVILSCESSSHKGLQDKLYPLVSSWKSFVVPDYLHPEEHTLALCLVVVSQKTKLYL